MDEKREDFHIEEKAAKDVAGEEDVQTFSFLECLSSEKKKFLTYRDIENSFDFINKKTLQNRLAMGTGPKGSFICLGSRIFPTKEFLSWLDLISEHPKASNENKAANNRRGRKTKVQEIRERRNIK